MMKAYLIVEAGDPSTADWFYADSAWKALDAAGCAGFNETRGYAIVASMAVDVVCVSGDGWY